jgi:hypothetical protein
MNESTLMMSSELQGLVQDLEDESIFGYGQLAVVLCKVVGQDEPIKGNLIGVSAYDHPDIELKIDITTALEIFKNMADITFESIQIIYLETSVSLGGPFMISGVKVCNVDQPKQDCTLCLKLATRTTK